MQPGRIFVLIALSAASAFVCASAFGFIDKDLTEIGFIRSSRALLYVDKPLWLKVDHTVRPTIYFRSNDGGDWGDWKSLSDALQERKKLNATHWYRDAQRYMLDAVGRSYIGTELDQRVMIGTRGFAQTIRLVGFLDTGAADSVQLKVDLTSLETQNQRSVVVHPYSLPNAK